MVIKDEVIIGKTKTCLFVLFLVLFLKSFEGWSFAFEKKLKIIILCDH